MPTSKTSSANGFFDRESGLAELCAGLADLTAGHGHLFLLSGEPESTKPGRPMSPDARRSQRVSRWCGVGAGGRRGAPAYRPWIQMVRACLTDADAEQRAAILGSEATLVAQDIAQLLPELRAAHARTPRPPRPQPADPEQARFQLVESVATLLKNVARIGPRAIVVRRSPRRGPPFSATA
jgi:eukaryotic-like serine/threonine-protein kinase